MKRLLLAALTGMVMLSAGSTRTSAQSEPLSFFKNFFITGDYVVGGVGLSGSGSNHISISGVPPGTDIAAAFLYWQVVDKNNVGPTAGATGVSFRGYPLSGADGPAGKVLSGVGTPACSSGGGGASNSNLTYSYRADVLRYLAVDPATGKLAANGVHAVTVPNGQGIDALGASLVILFRDPDMPLRAVVMYDGAHTMNSATGVMVQPIKGFYDAGTSAKLTHIVGSGQSNTSETLRYNGQVLAVDPFRSSRSAQWDNPTYVVVADPTRDTVTTSVDHAGFSSYGCFTWSAIVYSTAVKDSDNDGLLDRWEASAAPIYDPRGQQLPNLNAMGASSTVKDVFIEVGYMHTDENGDGVPDNASYGGVVKQGHAHLPGHDALKLMGDAFANAPSGRVNLHFDVGATYPAGDPLNPANNADAYLVPRGLARGGEGIRESVTQCAPGANVWECQFSQYPGTVGWKSGFRFLRDEVLNPVPVPAGQDDPCDAAGATCERRFDRNRTHMFHYALFAHALGLPQSEKACVVDGVPTDDVNGVCAAGTANPKFHTPVTNTGIGDFPGGDLLVTLGGFNDLFGRPTGTPFMQASTLMHEFGHNAERRHGGEPLEQNCKPTYLSVMNYMYQLRGLLDDNGTPNLDFSGTVGAEVNETGLGTLAYQPYRLGWYAPLDTSYLAGRRLPALRHCNGSDLLPGEAAMVRIDARTAAGVIDWDADGRVGSATALDVNFNGRLDGPAQFPTLLGSDDWSNLALNQIGSRRNVGGLYRDLNTGAFIVGPLSLDSGKGDLGKGDLGKGDLGKGDLGGGDLFLNDPNNPPGELNAVTAADLAKGPPNTFGACVIGAGCRPPITGALHDVHLSFTAPNEGNLASFVVYRVDGADLVYAPAGQPQQVWTPVATLPAVLGQSSYQTVDSTELVDGASYTYFAVARYLDDPATARVDAVESDPSRLVTIVGVNAPPAAGNDAYTTNEDTPLTVPAPGVLGNDGDPDSPLTLTTQVGTGPANGTVTVNADGSFVYTPAANFNGTASFTYTARSGAVSLTATVTITVSPVNDAPTISDLGNVTIDAGTSTTPLAFTIGDVDGPASLAGLTVSGTSSNATLVPAANIVFGWSGANRTVTVTPAAAQSGTATITVTVTDAGGLTASDTFVLTVRRVVAFTFVGTQNIPPPANRTFKAGSSIPLGWRYQNGTTVVDSSIVRFEVTVVGPLPNPTVSNADSGQSSFRYSGGAWSFNLQTKNASGAAFPVGTYQVTVKSLTAGFPSSAPFTIQLVK